MRGGLGEEDVESPVRNARCLGQDFGLDRCQSWFIVPDLKSGVEAEHASTGGSNPSRSDGAIRGHLPEAPLF